MSDQEVACRHFSKRYGWQRDQTLDPPITRCFHCCNISLFCIVWQQYFNEKVLHFHNLSFFFFAAVEIQQRQCRRWVVVIIVEEQRDDNAGSRKNGRVMSSFCFCFFFFSPHICWFFTFLPETSLALFLHTPSLRSMHLYTPDLSALSFTLLPHKRELRYT